MIKRIAAIDAMKALEELHRQAEASGAARLTLAQINALVKKSRERRSPK